MKHVPIFETMRPWYNRKRPVQCQAEVEATCSETKVEIKAGFSGPEAD